MTRRIKNKPMGKKGIVAKKQVFANRSAALPPEKLTPVSWRKILLALAVLLGVSLTLNCIGITWGQPSGQLWHSDSIAGLKSVSQIPNLFAEWKFKYPRVHFLVNAAVYKPFLDHWKRDPVPVRSRDGRMVRSVLNVQRISTLIIASRVVSALMGAGAVLAVFLIARLLFDDYLAGLLAALALAVSQLFVFYSHLGNVDIPAAFWFAWSLYWAVKAVYIGKWRHFVLLGLFCSLAICTKDPTAGFVVGLALAVWVTMTARAKAAGKSFKQAVFSVFNCKTLVAVIVIAFCFALLNDLLTTPDAFFERMEKTWFGKFGISFYQHGFRGQFPLLKKTYQNFYYALGWPLLATTAISLVYCAVRYRWKLVFAVLPLVAFYLMVIVRIQFSYPRFFLASMPALALFIGKTCADWLSWRKIPLLVRLLPIVFVYGSSALYCIGIDLEMVTDSRYQAERWFVKNVDRRTHVAAISPVTYAPRLYMEGYPISFRCRWDRDTTEEVLRMKPAYPEYIIMTEKWYTGSRFDRKFRKALFDGSLGYKEVASFGNKYLWPKKTIFGFAGRPRARYNLVSPKIIILQKQ